jgi:hypothetical protein
MRELTEWEKQCVIDSIPGANLVGFWPALQGRGGTLLDRSKNGNNGTISGATWVRLTSGLKVLKFNGSSQYVDLGTMGTFGSGRLAGFTFSCWVKPTDALARYTVIGVIDNPSPKNNLTLKVNTNHDNTLNAGAIRLSIASSEGVPKNLTAGVNANVCPAGYWTHIYIIVLPATNEIIFYVNGALAATTYFETGSPVTFANFTQHLIYGALNNVGSLTQYFKGYMGMPILESVGGSVAEALRRYTKQKELVRV